MTLRTSTCLFLLASLLGCLDPRSLLSGSATPGEAGTVPPPGPSEVPPTAAPASAETHRTLGIVDPERGNMVAFALKIPADWTARQRMTRSWEGAVATPQVTLEIRSPSGSDQVTWYPVVNHLWSEGPMTAQLRAQKRSFGLDPRTSPNELAPMSASAYARTVAVPRLMQQEGLALGELTHDQDAPEVPVTGGVTRRGSVDGTLPDGTRVRVECRMRVGSQQIQSDTYTAWSVVTSVTRSTTDLEAAHAHTRFAQDSIVTNPSWSALESQDQQRGYAANGEASRRQHEATMAGIQQNTAAMTAGHNARMAAIEQSGAASTAAYEDRMAAMDHDQALTISTIRGESLYADPTTGQQVMVQDGSNHVYRANNGQDLGNAPILGTSTALDPQQVDWVALQQVPLSEY